MQKRAILGRSSNNSGTNIEQLDLQNHYQENEGRSHLTIPQKIRAQFVRNNNFGTSNTTQTHKNAVSETRLYITKVRDFINESTRLRLTSKEAEELQSLNKTMKDRLTYSENTWYALNLKDQVAQSRLTKKLRKLKRVVRSTEQMVNNILALPVTRPYRREGDTIVKNQGSLEESEQIPTRDIQPRPQLASGLKQTRDELLQEIQTALDDQERYPERNYQGC